MIIHERVEELVEIVADPLALPIRQTREQHELERLRAGIEEHEHGAQQ
ncbi:hypothetical protein [Streptomyces sp. NPDC054887]